MAKVQKRQSRPKVKTGCLVCRQRRIKCDETRPSCKRCVKSKRECHGYPPPPRPPGTYPLPLLRPKPFPVPPRVVPSNADVRKSRSPRSAHVAQALSVRAENAPCFHTARTFPKLVVPSSLATRPAGLSLSPQESLHFQLFHDRTSSELSGYFDHGFWTNSVLRCAAQEPSVFYSVSALGALYRTLEIWTETPPSSPGSGGGQDGAALAVGHWRQAVTHYQEALHAMMRIEAVGRHSIRTSLMANVLLACFDSFIGDHCQAIKQIQNGLLLVTCRDGLDLGELFRTTKSVNTDEIDRDLIRMFARLAIQAKTYDMAFHFPEPHVVRLIPAQESDGALPRMLLNQPSEPPSAPFSDLLEARTAWDSLVYRVFCFTEAVSQAAQKPSPMGLLPRDVARYGADFHLRMGRWAESFEPLFRSRAAEGVPAQIKSGVTTLKMTFLMSRILMAMKFGHDEMEFDQYADCFQTIVNLALEVLADQEAQAILSKRCLPHDCVHKKLKVDIYGRKNSGLLTYHVKPSFCADMGIIQPLYVVATKCRDPFIRRQAIRILRNSARREAMWDSWLCAEIAVWIMNIEEEGSSIPGMCGTRRGSAGKAGSSGASSGGGGGAQSSRPSTFVPGEKRVMVTAVDMDLKHRVAFIRCGTRGLKPGTADLRARETTLRW